MRTGHKQHYVAGENTISPMMDAIEEMMDKDNKRTAELIRIKMNARKIVEAGMRAGLIRRKI